MKMGTKVLWLLVLAVGFAPTANAGLFFHRGARAEASANTGGPRFLFGRRDAGDGGCFRPGRFFFRAMLSPFRLFMARFRARPQPSAFADNGGGGCDGGGGEAGDGGGGPDGGHADAGSPGPRPCGPGGPGPGAPPGAPDAGRGTASARPPGGRNLDQNSIYYGSRSLSPQQVAQARADEMARTGNFNHLGNGFVDTTSGRLSEGIGWGQGTMPSTCVARNGTAAVADATARGADGSIYRVRLYNSPEGTTSNGA